VFYFGSPTRLSRRSLCDGGSRQPSGWEPRDGRSRSPRRLERRELRESINRTSPESGTLLVKALDILFCRYVEYLTCVQPICEHMAPRSCSIATNRPIL